MNADILVRDGNGNTLAKAELVGLPYDGFSLTEAHVSTAGTLIVTVHLERGEDE